MSTKEFEDSKKRVNKDISYIVDEIKKKYPKAESINAVKIGLIASCFRVFKSADDSIREIGEILQKDDASWLVNNYKSYLGIQDKEVRSDNDDFIPALAVYRESCCPDDKLHELRQEFFTKINDDQLAFIFELIQNADDCNYPKGVTPSLSLTLEDNCIILQHNEVGMTHSNIIALSSAGESDKGSGKIGEKGIGFKTIFEKCSRVDVVSGGYSFSLIEGGFRIDSFEPKTNYGSGTTMILHLFDNSIASAEQLYNEMRKKYGIGSDKNALFTKCPVLYTNNLRSIEVSCKNKSFSVSVKNKKYNETNHTVSATIESEEKGTEPQRIDVFGIYTDIRLSEKAVKERYPETGDENNDYSVQRIEIIAALDPDVTEGNMYSFLPCAQKIKAPFNVQLPVKLNLNRTRMFFIGDSDTSTTNAGKTVNALYPDTIRWNQEVITEFIKHLKDFYDCLKMEFASKGKDFSALYRYIPDLGYISRENKANLFALPEDKNYMNTYCNNSGLITELISIPYFKAAGKEEYCSAGRAILFDELICSKMKNAAWSWAVLIEVNSPVKPPVEYCEGIEEYTKRVGLTMYDYSGCSRGYLTQQFNILLAETGCQDIVLEHIDGNYDILNYVDKDELELYCASTNFGDEYLPKNGLWFKSEKLKSFSSCFFHFTTKKHADFYKGKGIDIIPAETLTQVLEYFSEKRKLSAEEFMDLCAFLNNNVETDAIHKCIELLKKDDEVGELLARIVRDLPEGYYDNHKIKDFAKIRLGFDRSVFEKQKTPITSFEACQPLLEKLTREAETYILNNTMNNADTQETNSNDPAFELIQNADDSKRRNRTNEVGEDFSVTKSETQDGAKIVLRYSEAGFSLWDFFCITARGYSSNTTEALNTGKFGTGFKSVYTVCDKVEIFSGDVHCVLDTGDNPWGESRFDDILKSSPIPRFSKREITNPAEANMTEVHLFFYKLAGISANRKKANEFYERLIAPENYVFLKGIDYPGPSEYPFPRDKGNEYGFYYCYYPDGESPEDMKPLYELYFPFEVDEHLYPLYCGMPMKSEKRFPFMLNTPRIEIKQDRTGIMPDSESNRRYLEQVFSSLQAGFEEFAGNYPEYAYSYIPDDGIDIHYYKGIIRAYNMDEYRIYPYHCGDSVSCTSKNNIGRNKDVKIFSDTTYDCLQFEGVDPGLINSEISYIDREIKEIIFADRQVAAYPTLLDKLFVNGPTFGKTKDAEFINSILPFLRDELYNEESPEKLAKEVNIIKGRGTGTLAKFIGESGAAKHFRSSLVEFETVSGFRYGSDKKKRYFLSERNNDLIKSYRGKTDLDSVIIDESLINNSVLVGADTELLSLTPTGVNDYVFEDIDTAEDFFICTQTEVVKYALDLNDADNSGREFKWLCGLFEEAEEPKYREKYIELIVHVLKKDINKNIKTFIKQLSQRKIVSPYNLVLEKLIVGEGTVKASIDSLVGLIPYAGDDYCEWLIGIFRGITGFDKDSVERVKHTIACQLNQTTSDSQIKCLFELLSIITKTNDFISNDTIERLLRFAEKDLSYAQLVYNVVQRSIFPKEQFLEKYISIYQKSLSTQTKLDEYYSLFVKNLNKEDSETSKEIIDILVNLILNYPQDDYYDLFVTAVSKLDDYRDFYTYNGKFLTTVKGFNAWLESLRVTDNLLTISFDFDEDSISAFRRLSSKTDEEIWHYYKKAAENGNRTKYSIFQGEDGIPVYFFEGDEFIQYPENGFHFEDSFDNSDIVLVPHKKGELVSALKKLLNSDHFRFMTCETIDEISNADGADNECGMSAEEMKTAKEAAKELLSKSDDEIKSALIQNFEVCQKRFRGYGAEKKCPMCGGSVFAEASALNLVWISDTKAKIPMLLCGSCRDFIDRFTWFEEYTFPKPDSDDSLLLSFNLAGEGKKSAVINPTFLHRLLLEQIEVQRQNAWDDDSAE